MKKNLKAFTMVEIMISIAIIITLSYLATPLIQKQRMIDDVRNIVDEVSNILNNDIRDPFYGYIQENTNTLENITNNGTCKTDSTIPPCAGNLTYRCISSNRVAYCSDKHYLKDHLYDSSYNNVSGVGNGFNSSYLIKLKSIPNVAYIQLTPHSDNTFKFKVIVKGDRFSSVDKNLILTMIKSKLFSEIGIFSSIVESETISTLCSEAIPQCEIEYILR